MTGDTLRLDERRHPRFARRRIARAGVRVAQRHPDRTRWRAGALLRGRRAPSAGALGRLCRSTSRCPGCHPQLREVNTYLGWFGRASRALQALSVARRRPHGAFPGSSAPCAALPRRLRRDRPAGPTRRHGPRRYGTWLRSPYDSEGRELASVHLAAGNGYEFTARILAWGASRAAAGLAAPARVGPAEAFGLCELERGCREAGLRR